MSVIQTQRSEAGAAGHTTSAITKSLLTGLMLALSLASLDQNAMTTALPRITGELGGLQHLSWVITGFMLASTVSTPLYGSLSDLYGRKPAFAAAISLFLLGSLLCGIAASMGQLIVFRILQGLGAGGLLVLTLTVIADLAEPRERGRYQGLFAGTFGICAVSGPLLGGVLTQYASWRWIFFINLPLGAAALALIIRGLKTSKPVASSRLDVAGIALLTIGTSCLLWSLSSGGSTYAWASAPILTSLAVSIAALASLVTVERRAAQPILPPALFHDRVFLFASAVLALTGMAMFAVAVYLPLMLQLLKGLSPSRSGLFMLPMMGGLIVASFTAGRLVSRTGRYKLLPILGLLAASICVAALAWAARADLGTPSTIAVLFVLGSGLGLVTPALTMAIQNAVPNTIVGAATSIAGFSRSLGAALGIAIAGAVLAQRLTMLPRNLQSATSGVDRISTLPVAQHDRLIGGYRDGFFAVFTFAASMGGLGLIVCLFLPELPIPAKRG
ncbi:MAG: DHA2 family efflux MFS transporter permease subunit [Pseudomonadota bacterium]|nr:DHA2 family efflux MFS transporter permease subunit [Pseudomonadota bacterium]